MRNEKVAPSASCRPRLPAEKRHRRHVTVHLLDAELELIQQAARQASLPISVYLRKLALGHRVQQVQIPAVNLDAVAELNALGNNLNQLTKLTHQGRLASSLEPLLFALLSRLDQLGRTLTQSTDGPNP
jgi:hypothetical protein